MHLEHVGGVRGAQLLERSLVCLRRCRRLLLLTRRLRGVLLLGGLGSIEEGGGLLLGAAHVHAQRRARFLLRT